MLEEEEERERERERERKGKIFLQVYLQKNKYFDKILFKKYDFLFYFIENKIFTILFT